MSDAIKSLTLIQIGEESTRGTEVAATRRLLTKEATYRFNEEMEPFLEQMTGNLARSSVDPIVTRNVTEFEIGPNDLDFEQILLFLLSGVKGAVTATQPGSGEARLWTFTPSVTADPAPDTYTIEFEESDGTNLLEQQALYGFTTEFSITAGLEGIPQLAASMVARTTTLGTKTADVSLPTVTYGASGRMEVYIDSSWANLGTTQITGQVHSITFTFSNFLYPKYTLEERSGLDFAKYAWRQRLINVSMEVSVDPNSGLVPDEDGNKTAGTKRFVRIQHNGGAFDSPDNGLARYIRIDGAFHHSADSMSERGGADGDGNNITTMHLGSTYDSTQGQDIEISIQTALATFP